MSWTNDEKLYVYFWLFLISCIGCQSCNELQNINETLKEKRIEQ